MGRMHRSKSRAILTIALALALLGLTGCGELEKALEELATQDVDFYQGFYDGAPQRVPRNIEIAEEALAQNTGPKEVSINATDELSENLAAFDAGLEEVVFGLAGKVQNTEGGPGRLYVFFAPTSTPAENEAVEIASLPLAAYQEVEFADSTGFDQSPAEIEANIADYFAANVGEPEYHVFLYAEGLGGILAKDLRLTATPAFAKTRVIPAALISGYSKDSVGEIVSVGVTGSFENLGTLPARFTWCVAEAGDAMDVNSNALIDVTLAPGEKIDATDALKDDALKTLKEHMERLVKGANISGSLFVVSDDIVNIDVRKFRVEVEAEVSVY